MKKLSLVLFSILMIFSMCVDVKAGIKVNGEGFYGDGIKFEGSKDVWHSLPGFVPNGFGYNTVGIRISFANYKGETLKSYDYIIRHNSSFDSSATKATQGYNKVYYSKGRDADFNTKANLIIDGEGTDLFNIFSNYGFTIDTNDLNSDNSVSGYAYKVGLAKDWFNEDHYNSEKGKEKGYASYNDALKALIKHFLPDYDMDSAEDVKKLFFVIEPTTVIHIKASVGGKLIEGFPEKLLGQYYGTAYELAQLAAVVPDAKEQFSLTQTFYTTLTKNLPCAGWVRGEVSLQVQEMTNFEGFNKTTYFGTIKTLVGAETTCAVGSKTHFTNDQVTGNNAIGMAVVWFYDKLTFDKKEVTCSLVHEKANFLKYDKSTLIRCENVGDLIKNFKAAIASDDKFKLEYPDHTKVTSDWYKKNCHCETPPPSEGYNCTPDYTVGTCSSKEQLSYSDVNSDNEIEFWNQCIYDSGVYSIGVHKSSDNSTAYSYEDINLVDDNNYCKVNCVETLNTNFKIISETNVFKAGYHLKWPTGTTLSGSRTCKLELNSADWDKYESELTAANNATLENYNKYSEHLAKYNELNEYTRTNSDCACKREDTKYINCIKEYSVPEIVGGTVNLESINYLLCDKYTSQKNGYQANGYILTDREPLSYLTKEYTLSVTKNEVEDSEDLEIEGTLGEEDEETSDEEEIVVPESVKVTVEWETTQAYKCLEHYKYYTNSNPTVKYTTYSMSWDELNSSTKTFNGYGKSMCEDDWITKKGTEEAEKNQYYNKYTTQMGLASDYIEQMQKCYNWSNESNKDKVYNLEPIIKLETVDTGYSIPSDMEKLESKLVNDDYKVSNNCEENSDYYYKCDSSGCKKEDRNVKNCSGLTLSGDSKLVASYSKEIEYRLNDNLFRYVRKDNNQSVSEITDDIGSYIDRRYGNIPIAYSKADGKYNITFTYSNLGHSESGSTKTDLDYIFENLKEWEEYESESDDYGIWSCKYTVNSELIPEKTIHPGINVIYRPIDLNNPFPGIDGAGRERGSNWQLVDVDTIITNSIPDEPMYSFKLTPSIIQQIRKYNRNNNYDDFKLTCEKSSGKACVSTFIDNLIKGDYGDTDAAGTCTNSTTRNYNDSSSFYGC